MHISGYFLKKKMLKVELPEGTLNSSARSNVQMPPLSFFFFFLLLLKGVEHPFDEATLSIAFFPRGW